MGKLFGMVCALSVLVALAAHLAQDGLSVRAEDTMLNEELESEMQLKRMLAYVTPLMAILRKDQRIARDAPEDGGEGAAASETGRQYYGGYGGYSGYSQAAYSKNGYGGGGGGGGYGHCCQKKDDLLPLLALLGLAGLLLYLILIASTTTTAAGRKRRGLDDNDIDMTEGYDMVLLDGPTWLSMVHELWEQDGALENTACAQETLCRMNRLAMAAPGQAGWAVSLSSLPLSYLLHTRHTGGFTAYMDASLMGRAGVNCSEIYSACPRLH